MQSCTQDTTSRLKCQCTMAVFCGFHREKMLVYLGTPYSSEESKASCRARATAWVRLRTPSLP